jgi:hypothetical protein
MDGEEMKEDIVEIIYKEPYEMTHCDHKWIYYQIGPFPFDYRRCDICERNETLEMPMCVWRWMKPIDYDETFLLKNIIKRRSQ